MNDDLMREIDARLAALAMPPRTVGSIALPASRLHEVLERPIGEIDFDLRCVDCAYRTNSLLLMADHQRNQAREHTRRQRLRRAGDVAGDRLERFWTLTPVTTRIAWAFLAAELIAMAIRLTAGAGWVEAGFGVLACMSLVAGLPRLGRDFFGLKRELRELRAEQERLADLLHKLEEAEGDA